MSNLETNSSSKALDDADPKGSPDRRGPSRRNPRVDEPTGRKGGRSIEEAPEETFPTSDPVSPSIGDKR